MTSFHMFLKLRYVGHPKVVYFLIDNTIDKS